MLEDVRYSSAVLVKQYLHSYIVSIYSVVKAVESYPKITSSRPCTKATDLDPISKVITELTEPHCNHCQKCPDP